MMTGKPISAAIRPASSGSSITAMTPGTVLTPASAANFFDSILSPITSIALMFGPMSVMPASCSARAKAGFSDRKPKPG